MRDGLPPPPLRANVKGVAVKPKLYFNSRLVFNFYLAIPYFQSILKMIFAGPCIGIYDPEQPLQLFDHNLLFLVDCHVYLDLDLISEWPS